MNLTTAQEFVVKECFVLAWGASVQRTGLYKPNTDHGDFQTNVMAYIRHHLLPQYVNTVSEEQHLTNIQELVAEATTYGIVVLKDGYRYGIAQKLLNLMLKYMWCLGHIAEPPHCPIDRIVIDKTSLKGRVNWTEIVDQTQYVRVINSVKAVANVKQLSVAQWELEYYGRR